MSSQLHDDNALLHSRIKKLEEKLKVQQLKSQQEINFLKYDLGVATKDLNAAKEEINRFKEKLASRPSDQYKTLTELRDPQYFRHRKEEIQKQLGPAYKIVDDVPELSKISYLAFQRIYRLSNRVVTALSKLPNSTWPTVGQLRYFENRLITNCGGFTQKMEGDVLMIWATNPALMFHRYLENLITTVWNGKAPGEIKVVISGDKGSSWTKFGLFVPTNVPNSQSPYNFLLLAMHKGDETRHLIEKSTAIFFEFVNWLAEREGMTEDFGNGEQFIKIDVLFVADLKMLPLVFGVSHHAAKTFCPMCHVQRSDHRLRNSSGPMRDLIEDEQKYPTLLNIPIENVVCPPLHLIQGTTNKIIELMDSDTRKDLFGAASVKPSYRQSSLLTGRDGQKVLNYVVDNAINDFPYYSTFTALYKLSQWASVEKYKRLARDPVSTRQQLDQIIEEFSNAWRNEELPTINKLHVIEQHLADFIIRHNGWGAYGEQGIESLHHLGNVAEKCCFGINQDKAVQFFMKVHLVLAISNTKAFDSLNTETGQSTPNNDEEEEDEINDGFVPTLGE